jgi:hypothetical protein
MYSGTDRQALGQQNNIACFLNPIVPSSNSVNKNTKIDQDEEKQVRSIGPKTVFFI